MIKLKNILLEYRKNSNSWIAPNGQIFPVRDTHDTTARYMEKRSSDPMMTLWEKGYMRVTYMHNGTLFVHNEAGKFPTNKQMSILKDIAIEGEHPKINFDNGTKEYTIWSNIDQT